MIFTTILAAVLLAVSAEQAGAEVVQHRGFMVDHKATTLECLSCHDGKSASSVSSCDKNMCRVYANHPFIASKYPRFPGRKYATIPEILADGLELEDGTVGCYTCHDIRNTKIRAQMVIPRDGKDLCAVCHKI